MVSTGTSANRTFQLKIGTFPWEIDDLSMTFLEKQFCQSKSEALILWVIFSIEFLVMSLALYLLCCLIRTNHTVPIFVINLFISDVLQICTRPVINLCSFSIVIALVYYINTMSILANVGFMVCISMERYIMIKYPVWYRFHNTSKNLVLISLLVWMLPVACMVADWIIALKGHMEHAFIVNVVVLLLPYPLVVFSFVGSWKALSHSVAVTHEEQKRILKILGLVLFNYTALFLPGIVQSTLMSLSFKDGQTSAYDTLNTMSRIFVYLNPLADCMLYGFSRKDANIMFKCLCCEKSRDNQMQTADSSRSLTRRSEV